MKYKGIFVLAAGLLGFGALSAYAADDKAANDENIVVGACMVQKFKAKSPSLTQSKLEKCASVDASAAPKCLGMSTNDYAEIVKKCIGQLNNARCVAVKMKLPLLQYAGCDYEKDPAACYKGLGYSMDQVAKLSADCQAAAATANN